MDAVVAGLHPLEGGLLQIASARRPGGPPTWEAPPWPCMPRTLGPQVAGAGAAARVQQRHILLDEAKYRSEQRLRA